MLSVLNKFKYFDTSESNSVEEVFTALLGAFEIVEQNEAGMLIRCNTSERNKLQTLLQLLQKRTFQQYVAFVNQREGYAFITLRG